MDCCENMKNGKLPMGAKFLSFLLAIGLIVVSIVAVSMANKTPYNPEASFMASGKVMAKPDIALVSLSVKTPRETEAATVVSKNSETMNKIIEMLKAKGIEEKDVKSSSFSVNPVYSYPTGLAPKIDGYEAYQELQVKIRDLEKIGDVIASSAQLGANQIGNISFTIDDPENLKMQAREKAVAAAKEKAMQMEKITGIDLGEVVNVYETSYDDHQPVPYYAAKTDMGMGMSNEAITAPQIASGENEIRVDVTLVYKVKK